jgi:hypothetical protein
VSPPTVLLERPTTQRTRGSDFAPLLREIRTSGLPYLSTGIIDSYAQGMRHMHDVGRQLRGPNVVPALKAS